MHRNSFAWSAQRVSNILTYPLSDQSSGLTVVHTNYFPNPRATNATSMAGWAGNSPNVMNATNVDNTWSMSLRSRRYEWTNTDVPGTGDIGLYLNVAYAALGIGLKATVRMMVTSNRAITLPAPTIYSVTGTKSMTAWSPARVMTPGVPVEVWATFTADATATADGLRMISSSWVKQVGDVMEISDVDVYFGDYQNGRTWFSGTTPTASDFTYSWISTADNSTSRRNAPTPLGISSSGSGIRSTYMSVDRPPYGATRFVRTAVYDISPLGINTVDAAIPDGVTRTDLFWIRTNRAVSFSMRYRNAAATIISNPVGFSTVADKWTLIRQTVQGGAGLDTGWGLIATSAQFQNGDVVDVGPRMTVFGTYEGDFIPSAGYFPQLYDIAGKPEYDVTAAGTYTLPGGFTNTEPRTLYTVYQNTVEELASNNYMVAEYGATALSDVIPNQYLWVRQQFSSSPGNNVLVRRTGGTGALSGGSALSENVVCYGLNAGGYIFNQINNGTTVIDNQVMDIPHEKLRIPSPAAGGSHIRTIIYRGYHDITTRAAISRYLGNKYGAYVA